MGQKRSYSNAFVEDPKERMRMWKRRSATLVKLTGELSTLCDTPACIVITCPNPNSDETGASSEIRSFVFWPGGDDNGPVALRRMIDLYKAKTGSSSSSVKNPCKKKKDTIKKAGSCDAVNPNPVMPNVVDDETTTTINVMAAIDTQILEVQARIDAILERKKMAGEDDVSRQESDVIIRGESYSDNNVYDIDTDIAAASAIGGLTAEDLEFLNTDSNNVNDHCLIDFGFLDNVSDNVNDIAAANGTGGLTAEEVEFWNSDCNNVKDDCLTDFSFLDKLSDNINYIDTDMAAANGIGGLIAEEVEFWNSDCNNFEDDCSTDFRFLDHLSHNEDQWRI